ncbi:hypothetical protein L1987_03379 [Smallanthus sonchifolius]|uniref:Uncharacterized protein n=1 Tax=Smallanthus sonchifolius TaxID=185202 RepID=A0ACB9KAF3_9ASTR|nr:hypothetical protein L1987_03379 [Smallanthus sonchifolius]
MNDSVSARKIGANLWEVQPQFNFKKLHDDAGLIHQRRRRHHSYEKEGSDQLQEDNSSLPVTTHDNLAITPTGYALNTSSHLLKVLDHISNLEQQHSRNTVLIKSLKRDLDISRAQVKTLVEERKRDHQEIKELKRLTHDRKEKVVQSTKDELFEVKSAFMREKKARVMVESLCDEFAKGIRDYEQKLRFLQQNRRGKDQIVGRNKPDWLILHVSEAWLDERVQMKCDFAENTSISDNLSCEIETFLESKRKQSHGCGVDILEENRSCGVLVEPSSKSVSRMTDQGPRVTESSSQPMSRTTVQAPGVVEPSTRGARVGVKANTLMAKLLEARLESQFSKAGRVRR